MATKKKPAKPLQQEMAHDDHGFAMSYAYTHMLIQNPDSVLKSRGPDFKVYDELLRDDQVKSCFQQRRSALTSSTWKIDSESESATDKAAAEFLRQQLEKVGWDDITDKMLYGVFYGFSVAEFMWGMTEDNKVGLDAIKVRDRSRFKWNVDNQLMLMDDLKHSQGLVMPENKFWTYAAGASHDDNPYGQGLAHSLYWPVFFKRNDIKFWLVFLEKFGMPTTAIRIPDGQMNDPVQIRKAKSALQSIQQDSGVVIPDSMVIELIEAARSGTADYAQLAGNMDGAISKVILSQTMTTDSGSSRSQAEVHQGVANDLTDADGDLIADSFKSTAGKWLTEWNFPGAGVPSIVRDTAPPEDLNHRAERDAKIYALGYDPTLEYIEDTYGMGWEKRKEAVVPPALMTGGQGPMPAEFAEISSLLAARAGHRNDQQLLADAAAGLATKYKELYGKRVEQLLGYLEENQDFETFKKHIADMMEETAPQEIVDTVQRATVMGRLLGMLRGERKN